MSTTTIAESNQTTNTNESKQTNTKETSAATIPQPTSSPYLIPLPLTTPSTVASLLVPPLSFAIVSPGIFRSACPSLRNFPFLRGLGLKSIVYLSTDSYPLETLALFQGEGIEVRVFPIQGNREPFQSSDFAPIEEALTFVLDQRNHPLLLHCNRGKHRTGSFVGIIRRLSGLSLSSAFSEYTKFIGAASAASRDLDRLMIEVFDCKRFKKKLEQQLEPEHRPDWLA